MRTKSIITAVALLLAGATISSFDSDKNVEKSKGLKGVVKKEFLMGVALNEWQVRDENPDIVRLVKNNFNSIVAENCMKSEIIHPEEKVYDFERADQLVAFGKKYGMTVIGHCLIWHSQLAKWFPLDAYDNDVAPEVLKQRMKDHIYTIMGRYKGQIKGWDVVNEAILDDGSFRQTPFYRILGEEYIALAFQYAHEADPDAELYYNDYGMSGEAKRNAVVALVNKLKARGLRVDAIGMQGHMGLDYPDINDFEKSIVAFAGTGAKVMVTEWDMSALPTVNRGANVADTVAYSKMLNPYPDGLPEDVSEEWNKRMSDFFNLFRRHADVITRVNAWGLTDGDSWKNDWPMKGRKEYPLLFDRNLQPKPFVKDLLK
jgi:endo-1,4-beta-xylanase